MKTKSVIVLLITVLAAAGLGALCYFGIGENHLFGVQGIKQGLDLKGGVSITYEAATAAVPSAAEMQSAQSLIQERLDRKNYTEAEVAIQGNKRLRIDIPDIADVETAISEIGKTAQLFFVDEEGQVLLTGSEVSNAYKSVTSQGGSTGSGEIVVALEFNDTGKKLFEDATGNNVGKRIIIMLDEDVLSAPVVNDKISGGNAIITGSFTTQEAEDLAALIRAGSLPFKLDIMSTSNVGAKLGASSLETGLIAGAIGFVLILLFMLVVYKVSGLAANIALVIYLGLELSLLSLFGVTLTLPGIAGIVLSVGMAVDANVIIFERIREELESGRSIRASLASGFSRALPAIVDGNITTLIAAVILFWLGTGPVKGFAQTLALGIVISMFTAIVVTRIILKAFVGIGIINPKSYGAKEAKPLKMMNVIANRKKFFAFSALVIIIGVGVMVFNTVGGKGPFSYDVEFSGGTSLQIDVGTDFNNEDITNIITEITGQSSPQVQRILGTNQVSVKILSIDQETRIKLIDRFKQAYNIPDTNVSFDDFSPTVSSEMRNTAVLAISAASLAMLIYVSLRFRDVKKGGSAIFALLHDAMFMLTAYAILRISLNISFIAAILTILGYSINSTIVIFDRVRENAKKLSRPGVEELVDTSVSQTLRRSIYTSLTTLITVVCLYVLGVPSIKDFTLPIIVGLLAGTYSSVFISGSLWYELCKLGKNPTVK